MQKRTKKPQISQVSGSRNVALCWIAAESYGGGQRKSSEQRGMPLNLHLVNIPCGNVKKNYAVRFQYGLSTIMKYAKRGKEYRDLPSIPLMEGRFMFDYGRDDWRRRWDEVFQYEVLHWRSPNGTRLSIDSLITAAHPGLKEDKRGRALFDNSFLWRLREERRRSTEVSKRKRLAKDKNGGGTQ